MEGKKRMMWTTNIQEIVTKKFYLPRKHGFGANTKKKERKKKNPKTFLV